MKKRTVIGIGISIIIFSIIFGIASLPDEVLMESSSQIPQQVLPEELGPEKSSSFDDVLPKLSEDSMMIEKEPQVIEDETASTQGRKIEVKISDGIGAGDK